jgi:subtilisin family serine protease
MKVARTLAAVLLIAVTATAGAQIALAGPEPSSLARTRTQPLLNSSAIGQATRSTGSSPATMTAVASGRVLLRLKGSATPSALADVAGRARTTTSGVRGKNHGRLEWTVPTGRSAEAFAKELVDSGKVVYAVPSYIRKLASYTPPTYTSPNDSAFIDSRTWYGYSGSTLIEKYPYGKSWWLRDVRAPNAWAMGYTGPNIVGKYPLRAEGSRFTVAVLDSGLYSDHEDVGSTIAGGRDFFDHEDANGALVQDNDVTPVDPDLMVLEPSYARTSIASHGECVAGIVGATANNAVGTVGVGYDTHVVVHKVLGIFRDRATVGIDDGAVVDAIYYSVDNGAKVINMSFGGYEYSPAIAEAISYAHSNGVVVVAAKGNDASGAAFYPASNTHVVGVGALTKNANAVTVPASFSNYRRTSLEIMAPGTFVWGLFKPDVQPAPSIAPEGYSAWDGTSMASPLVAGAIAWSWRAAPALSASEITNVVISSSAYKSARTHYPYGYRALDMYGVYNALKAKYPLLGKPVLANQTVAFLGDSFVNWGVPTAPVRGVTYDVSVNGSPVATATAATSGTYGWTPGDYVVSARARSAYNWDDGTAASSATIHVLPIASGPSSWSAAHVAGSSAISAVPNYRQAVTIESTLRDASGTPIAGASPVLETSTNGVNFATAGTGISQLPNGVYRASVVVERRTYLRLRFSAVDEVGGSTSSVVVITPKVSVTMPWSKTSVRRNKAFKVSGNLRPAHATSSRVVQLVIKRWNGRSWVWYKNVWTRATYRGSYSSYAASLKLRRGSYVISARAPADSLHAMTISSHRLVKVK